MTLPAGDQSVGPTAGSALEVREHARAVVRSESLDVKLSPPAGKLVDSRPGPPLRLPGPGRPQELRIQPAGKVPPPEGFQDPLQRPRILHALANHELQAAELYAWALLAFPDAPAEYRQDLLRILGDEQRHTRMYIARLEAAGGRFGEYPVSGYFWNKTEHLHSPLHFVCAMALVFENANLDHTIDYAAMARQGGDEKTAAVIERIHRDEIEHVRFGWTWLGRLKDPAESPLEAWQRHLTWPLRPAKARGRVFRPQGRVAAGLDAEMIQRLEESLT